MKLLRIAFACAALCTAFAACDASRATAPDRHPAVRSDALPDSTNRDGQTMGSGG